MVKSLISEKANDAQVTHLQDLVKVQTNQSPKKVYLRDQEKKNLNYMLMKLWSLVFGTYLELKQLV